MPGLIEAQRWKDNQRVDGLQITEQRDDKTPGQWVIITASGASLHACPCCDLPFRTVRAAKLVADFVYPMRS